MKTQIYPIISLNGFLYTIDQQSDKKIGDYVFRIGLCNLKDSLWRKGNCLQKITRWIYE